MGQARSYHLLFATLILLGAGLSAAPARAQSCAAACSEGSSNRCQGTQACMCATSPRWQTSAPITWELFHHAGGLDGLSFAALESEVKAAFQAWDDQACSSLAFDYLGTFTSSSPSDAIHPQDRRNRLAWVSSGWAYGPGTLGVTHAVSTVGSNQIRDADIEFNDDNKVWSTTGQGGTIDVFSIVLHEVGHFWGATHTPDPGSVMYYAYPGGRRRIPSADDVAQLCCLYPATSSAGGQGDPCQSSAICQSGLVCARPASGGESICTRGCTPGGNDCPAGYESCESAVSTPAGVDNACFVAPSAPSDLCAFCDSGRDCSSGICLAIAPYGICSVSCSSNRQCGVGFRCATLSSGSSACVPTTSDPQTGALVCPSRQCSPQKPCPPRYHCDANGMCRGGGPNESCDLQNGCDDPENWACITTDGEQYDCRAYCRNSGDCGVGEDCFPLQSGDRGVCLPNTSGSPDGGTPGPDGGASAGPCGACSANSECPSGFDCVATSSGARCHKRCDDDGDCSSESVCALSGASGAWCACPADLAGRDQPCGQSVQKFCGPSDRCVSGVGSDDHRCRQRCTSNDECPSGRCLPISAESSVCAPIDGEGGGGTVDGGSDPGGAVPEHGCGCGSAGGGGLLWLGLLLMPALGRRISTRRREMGDSTVRNNHR